MTTTLYLTSSTEKALGHALEQTRAAKATSPLAPVHWLLPSGAVIAAARRYLANVMGVRLFQFYQMGSAALDAADQRLHRINDIVSRRLLHAVLGDMRDRGELTTFAGVWDKPGFVDALLQWLREMKSQGIPPEDVARHAASSAQPRDRQLALVYERYQGFLRAHGYSDGDGVLWLAAETLEHNPDLMRTEGPLLVLGFDQFSPLQVRILRALAGRFTACGIYLLWDNHRPADSLALSRLAETRRRLNDALAPAEELLEDAEDQGLLPLQVLRHTLFETAEEPVSAADMLVDGRSAVEAVAAPSREAEVRWAIRAIKQHLLAGIDPAHLALLAPQANVYARIVETVAEEYGVPMLVERPLDANPAVLTLLSLLDLHPNFPWRETMDALRSPYVCQPWLTPEQIDNLDRLSRERPVVAGRDQWHHALTPLSREESGDDEEFGPPRLASILAPDALAAIEQGLMAFFDHLAPPVQGTHCDYTLWLQQAVLGMISEPGDDEGVPESSPPSLQLLQCCQAGLTAERDLAALGLALRALRSLVQAAGIVSVKSDGTVDWPTFACDMRAVLSNVTIPPDPSVAGVHFASLEQGRAVAFDHLLVLGLAEGEFPRAPAPDVFYAAAERAAHPLPLVRPQPGEDACRWWQVIGNCRRSLTMLRPRLDDNGASWLPSPYWTAVLSKLPEVREEIPPIAAPPTLENAASPPELLTALAAQGARAVPPELAGRWQAITAAHDIARRRAGWAPAPAFEGTLQAADIQQDLAERYGPGHTWSVSRLNRYGHCPFGFFAQHVLHLEARADPEVGMDPMQRGSLLHKVLERLFRLLVHDELTLSTEHRDAVLVRLEESCDAVFLHAPERYGFRPGVLWSHEQEELRRQLRVLVAWECGTNGPQAAFRPYGQELHFGLAGSDLPRLDLTGPAGPGFAVHGVIDRIDRDASGHLRVIDYKSGVTPYSTKDIERGLALQVALYALAAERLTGAQVSESYYLHVPTRKPSGKLKFAGPVADEATVQKALASAGTFVQRVCTGVFPKLPGKAQDCTRSCDFAAFCRVDRHAIAKARRAMPASPVAAGPDTEIDV